MPLKPHKIEILFLPEVAHELLVNFPQTRTNSTLLYSTKMSQFFGSTNAPALRRCAARINGIPCGEVCQSAMSIFCNAHIPGFVSFPQQTYGSCTYFDSTGRICQNAVTSRNTPFCPEHRPNFMASPLPSWDFLPSCSYTENGLCCPRKAAIVPSTFGHSFAGCNRPFCEAHALPHIYNHFQGVIMAQAPPAQIQQIRAVPSELPSNNPPPSPATCSICTESIESELCDLRCKHAYHAKCIDQWFTTLRAQARPPTCPYCRSHVNQDDYRKVRIAALPDPSDDALDGYGGSDEAIGRTLANGDVYFRGHLFHVAADSDDEQGAYDDENDDGFDYVAPRNLLADFDQVANDDLDASAIAQQAFDEVVAAN